MVRSVVFSAEPFIFVSISNFMFLEEQIVFQKPISRNFGSFGEGC